MSEQENVDVMCDFFEGFHLGDKERMARHLAPDATYWIPPGTLFSGIFDKAGCLRLLDGLIEAQSGNFELNIVDITAQDDRAAAVVRGHMPLKKGGAYDNTHHWFFTFRDGQIIHVKEFFNTLAVWRSFGTPEQVAAAEAALQGAPDMPGSRSADKQG